MTTRAPASLTPPEFPPTPVSAARHVPLCVETRGGAEESAHFGSVAVVDRDGRVLYAAGDPHVLTFTRSTLKPLQAMPFVAGAGVARFGYSEEQVALMCASHSGEPRHVAAVADMLAKSGSRPEDLQCGAQAPGFYDVRGEVPPPPPYSPLAHNCSGKHAAMLAYCVMGGHDRGSYLAFDHPLQRAIRGSVAHFTGVPVESLVAGVDGCSAPNYAVPLAALARAFARLAADADDPLYGGAGRALARAMSRHPEMVSGEGRNDLAYMKAGAGDWLTKIGAEGVQAIGVTSRGIGIAVKVADGAKRGLHPAVVAVLEQLGLVADSQRALLAPWRSPTVRNFRGIATGDVRPVVVLDKA